MPLKLHEDDVPTLNLTPMIDVLFNLIIFFMVGTTFADAEKDIRLKVPTVTENGTLTAAPQKKAVNVYADGKLTLDREDVTLEELTNRLAAARSQYQDLGVLVRGEAHVSLQRVAEVLSACKKAGVSELAIAVRLAK